MDLPRRPEISELVSKRSFAQGATSDPAWNWPTLSIRRSSTCPRIFSSAVIEFNMTDRLRGAGITILLLKKFEYDKKRWLKRIMSRGCCMKEIVY